MKKSWTTGLDPDQEIELRGDFASSQVTRKRLAKLLDDKIKSSETLSYGRDAYEVANWPYKQADYVGYIRALREVIDLLD